ncbi:ATPase assembly factor ATP10 [Coprinopsis sp. MPI-PUGE-AT-0042]|nr:ATPase assembly factor ATP10 [Coprinopsis sp. MPI-PUGE-AT-0042]
MNSAQKRPAERPWRNSASNQQRTKRREFVLGPLTRPLGVRERPTTVTNPQKQKLKDMMDTDVLMAQRRHLIKEASKGYFHDLNMTRKHGGKTWIAPMFSFAKNRALYLPNIQGQSLLDKMCFGKISVLSVLGTQISEIQAKAFTKPTHERYKEHPSYQYIQVKPARNMMKALLVKLFIGRLKGIVPPEFQANYLVSSQNMEYVGYVFLIDDKLRIRWAACSDAMAEEIQSLESCTG